MKTPEEDATRKPRKHPEAAPSGQRKAPAPEGASPTAQPSPELQAALEETGDVQVGSGSETTERRPAATRRDASETDRIAVAVSRSKSPSTGVTTRPERSIAAGLTISSPRWNDSGRCFARG